MLKTAVYHAGALGDFLTILPFLEGLKNGEPGCSTSLLSHPAHMELAELCGLVEEVRDIGSSALSFIFSSPHSDKSQKFCRSFGRAFCIATRDNPVIRAFKSAKVQTYTQLPFPSDTTHVIDYHLHLLKQSDIRFSGRYYRMPLSPEPQRNRVYFHPGSGSARKNWPLSKFMKLSEMLRADDFDVGWICGPAESGLRPKGETVHHNHRISDLAKLIGTGALYVGNDSGVSHLAAITGRPTIVLFGASNPLIWAPRGPNVRVVQSHQTICSPCHPAPPGKTCTSVCMEAIGVEEVHQECRKLLESALSQRSRLRNPD
jgi:heptosyltransferase III